MSTFSSPNDSVNVSFNEGAAPFDSDITTIEAEIVVTTNLAGNVGVFILQGADHIGLQPLTAIPAFTRGTFFADKENITSFASTNDFSGIEFVDGVGHLTATGTVRFYKAAQCP